MADSWEVFRARKRPRQLGESEISLTKSNILLSEDLAKQLRVRWVVLLYNSEKHEIGVRPARAEEEGYKLSGRAVSWRSFREHFQITERGRYTARIENGMLICELGGGKS